MNHQAIAQINAVRQLAFSPFLILLHLAESVTAKIIPIISKKTGRKLNEKNYRIKETVLHTRKSRLRDS